ncbi:acyltransferase family protein [Sphingobium sp.]|uniref:acyltransferase family protein n=1 Tax=Sphingobium sp. TaxID=1912891 RepID=UPI003B3BD087
MGNSDNGQNRSGYIAGIDGLRAIAVLSVIAYHLNEAILPGGFVGVDIFFVISGFVVTQSLNGRHFPSLGSFLLHFYARRLLRIMPALVVMLLVTILATQLFIPSAWLSDTFQKVAKYAFFGASNIALALNADTYFSPRSQFNPFTHSWSLGVEEQFYFIFPFLMFWHQTASRKRLSRRQVEWMLAFLSAASLAACAALAAYEHRYAFYLIPARFWELGVGMLLNLTMAGWKTPVAGMDHRRKGALTIVTLALLAISLVIPETTFFPFPLALLPVLAAVGTIVIICALPDSRMATLLGARIPVTIGLISYSLYLWHWPIFVLFRWTVGLDSIATCLAALLLVALFAILSYRLVERPLRHHKGVAALPKLAVVTGSVAIIGASAFAGIILFRHHDRLSLSTTRDHRAWYSESARKPDPAFDHCPLQQATQPMGGGHLLIWRPQGCRAEYRGRLFAVGDSHNVAYAPIYRQLAADLGVEVRQYSRPNCGYLKLIRPMEEASPCQPFVDAIEADLKHNLRQGDVLFLAGLRLYRLTEEFDRLPAHDWSGGDRDKLAAGTMEAEHSLMTLARGTGARLILEAPKPLFRSPPFRCSDWFNRSNPICEGGETMPRSELTDMRQPVYQAMQTLTARVPGLRIWDPFPILCPGKTCSALVDGRPIFFDGDHISGHANDVLYPSFKAEVGKLLDHH